MQFSTLYTKRLVQTFFTALSLCFVSYCATAQTATVSIDASFPSALCEDSIVTIPFTVSGTFNAGNVFTFELSDPSGGFITPDTIGADTTTASGSIRWGIRSSLTRGTNYRIRIRSSNPATTSATDSVSIWTAPSFPNAKSNSPICSGDSIKLSSSSDPTASVLWTGPAGFSSTDISPVILSADTTRRGIYRVYAYQYGCNSYPDSVAVTVLKVVPTIHINTGLTDTICAGTLVSFMATTTSAGTSPIYLWQKNGVSVSSGSAYYATDTLSNNDTIKVIMVSSALCANPAVLSDKTLMIVKPLPARSIASSNSPVCSTDAISLRASTSSSGSTYQWTGPGGFTSKLQNPTIPSADSFKAGLYIVKAILNGCASVLDTDTVVVVPSIIPSVTLSYAPADTICAGQLLTFTANPVNPGSSPVYKWYHNGSLVTGATGTTYATDSLADGDGIICTLASSLTCPRPIIASYSIVVAVKPLPVITNVIGNSPLCSSDTIKLIAVSATTGISYAWTGPAGFTSTQQAPVIAPIDSSNTGTYSVQATLNGCVSAPKTTSILVNNVVHPTVSISVSPGGILAINQQATFSSVATFTGFSPLYQWQKNGFDIPGENNTTLVTNNFRDSDSISLAVTSSMACAVPAKKISNSITMHVAKPIPISNSISISPNPSKGIFVVSGRDSSGQQAIVKIFDMAGRLVYTKTTAIVGATFSQQVNISGLPSGVYMVHVKTEDEERKERVTMHH